MGSLAVSLLPLSYTWQDSAGAFLFVLKTRKSNLAKKIASVNANGCYSPDVDTNYVDWYSGDTITKVEHWLTSGGKAIEDCAAVPNFSTRVGLLNGSSVTMEEITANDISVSDVKLNAIVNIKYNSSTSSLTYLSMNAAGSFMGTYRKVSDFNLYAEYSMKYVVTDFTGETDPSITGTMTFQFMNGRYKCAIDLAALESGSTYSCDITHNNSNVGSLSDDGNGNMVVKDSKGNIVTVDSTSTL